MRASNKVMTKTEKTKIRRIIIQMTKKHTYREVAKYLASQGIKTPHGKRPNESFINNVISRNVLNV